MDFAAASQRQRAFFQTGATRSVEFRRAQLERLAGALERHEASLARRAARRSCANRRCQGYATEFGLVQAEIRHALRHLASLGRAPAPPHALVCRAGARLGAVRAVWRGAHPRSVELPGATARQPARQRHRGGQLCRAETFRTRAAHGGGHHGTVRDCFAEEYICRSRTAARTWPRRSCASGSTKSFSPAARGSDDW